MRQFAYKKKHPVSGKEMPDIGIVYISDDSMMDRVPEGAMEVGENPVDEDKEGAYFSAWRLQDDGTVTLDLAEAKNVRLAWLRERRDAFLEHLDKVQFRYYCSGNEDGVAQVEKEKQELRDFPANIDWNAIVTLHDIKHILPPILI